MLKQIIFDFHIASLQEANFGVDKYDLVIVFFAIIMLFVVDIIHEHNIELRHVISDYKLPIRWAIWYTLIFFVIITGAYGAGYTIMDMIYAAY